MKKFPDNDFIIDVRNLHKYFIDNHILDDVSFNVERGQLVSIIGRSGCGKTTLLRCMNCLEIFDEGIVRIAGVTLSRTKDDTELKKNMVDRARDFTNMLSMPFKGFEKKQTMDEDLQVKTQALRKRVGMLFQGLNLFPHLRVIDNVTIAPIKVLKQSKEEATEIAKKLLDKVGLSQFTDRYPFQLSGGQAQRVAIARALAMNPQVMLYDEPTSALDPELVEEVISVMKTLHSEGMTQIVVTHAMKFARDASDKVIYMENGQIIEISTPDLIFTNARDERTQKYVNIL